MPVEASSRRTATFAASIACSALTMEKNSTASPVLPRRRRPGGVDQRVAPAAALERHLDRVARGAGLVEGDDALLADQRVDQRRLADVGAADDGDARMASLGFFLALALLRGNPSRTTSISSRTPSPCAAEIGRGRAKAELVELGDRDVASACLRSCSPRSRRVSCSLRRRSAIARSPGVRPARPSTTNTIASASTIACSAWRAISTKMPCGERGSKPPVSMAMNERAPCRPSP